MFYTRIIDSLSAKTVKTKFLCIFKNQSIYIYIYKCLDSNTIVSALYYKDYPDPLHYLHTLYAFNFT